MPPSVKTADMGRVHEKHVAEALGGERHRGSGNQWQNPLDGSQAPDDEFDYRWDCKSTLGKSITITLDMIAKVTDQAQGHRPAIPLLWYGNEKLTEFLADWIAVTLADFSELQEAAREGTEAQQEAGRLRRELQEIRQELADTRDALALVREAAVQPRFRVQEAPGDTQGQMVPGYVPQLPWTLVSQQHLPGRTVLAGVHYDPDGRMKTFDVASVRVERSLGAANRPRLVINDVRTGDGDLYVDGVLQTRVWAANPAGERG